MRSILLVVQLALCNTYYTGTKLSHNVSCDAARSLQSIQASQHPLQRTCLIFTDRILTVRCGRGRASLIQRQTIACCPSTQTFLYPTRAWIR